MKKTPIILLLFLIAGILGASDTLFFKITLLGMHCASVEVIENQIDQDVTEITYHAFTVRGFDKIYKIDNWYYYYTDDSLSHMDSLKKNISNKDLKQFYCENVRDGIIHYTGTQNSGYQTLKTPKPVHHILSFLVYLQHYPDKMKNGQSFPFLITDEGDLYHPEITIVPNEKKQQDDIYFSLLHVAGEEILEPTDVFNWLICAGKGSKMLSYSHKDNTITEGAFSLGWGLYLRAKRIYK